MKSHQQDNKIIKTNCKNCIFAKYDGNTQIDCVHDRINKFKQLSDNNDAVQYVVEAYDEENEFFVINRLCTLYRDKNIWNNGIADKEKALEEVKITFDILINCNNLDDNYYAYIKKVMASAVLYNIQKFNFYLYHDQSLDKDSRKKILTLLNISPKCNLSVFYEKDIFEHNILCQTRNSYNVMIDYDHRVNCDIFYILNNIINNDLKKILVVKNKENYLISNLSYKIQTSGKTKVDIKQIINNIIEYSKPDFFIEV
jgi:hypothetical protein